MTLCQQTHGIDPLHYLTLFYNQGHVLNVRTVRAFWPWSSFILAILVSIQLYSWTKKTFRSSNFSLKKTNRRLLPTLVLSAVLVASIIFVLALVCQALMVIQYSKMDVIDWDGWTFGQVVAVLFWVPPLMECIFLFCVPFFMVRIRSCIGEYLETLSCAPYQHLLPSRAGADIPYPYRQCLAFQRTYSGSLFQFKRTFISDAICLSPPWHIHQCQVVFSGS
jgi:hypothetical protein